MTHITFVHGILNKPPPDVLLQVWRDALATNSGIDLAGSRITSSMVYWADVLYPDPEIPQDAAAPTDSEIGSEIDPEILGQIPPLVGRSPEESRFLAGLAGKFSLVALKSRVAQSIDGDQELVPLPWFLKEPLMAAFLRDVHHYLFNVEFSPRPGVIYRVQDEIRRRFVQQLREVPAGSGPHLVVSHSMGTVIAYDCLKRLPDCPAIDSLMTIGSPLGLSEVEEKLQPGWSRENGFPSAKVKRGWSNIFDQLDPVCGFAPRLAGDYQQLDPGQHQSRAVVQDLEQVNSGFWRHDIAKYLSGQALRNVLATQLQIAPLERPSLQSSGDTALSNALPSDLSIAQLLDELSRAMSSYDRPRVSEICRHLADEFAHGRAPFDAEQGASWLGKLRRKRYLDELSQLADAMIEDGIDSPRIRRLYAQALIDSQRYAPAELLLKNVIASCKDKDELAECRGLLGRVQKQIYVDSQGESKAKRKAKLIAAIDWYRGVYESEPEKHYWHGLNVVALLARARRDGISMVNYPRHRDLAGKIVKQLKEVKVPDHWQLASITEMYVALDMMGDALQWADKFVHHPEADAFEVNSLLRQLKDVWQLTLEQDFQAKLLILLQSELLKRSGGALDVSHAEIKTLSTMTNPAGLQKVFGSDRFRSLEWYMIGVQRCKIVARISTATNQGLGTGFLVRTKDLGSDWDIEKYLGSDDKYLLLTNAHVISDDPHVSTAFRPRDAYVTFESWDKAKGPYRVKRVVWTSAPGFLDATLVSLSPDLADCATCNDIVPPPSMDEPRRVYLIGHPQGGGLSLSLNDNLLLDYLDPRVHYRTPSEPGSSGSPVFDDVWRLIGLHHSGRPDMPRLNGKGVYEANEGILLIAICEALKQKFLGQNTNQSPSIAVPVVGAQAVATTRPISASDTAAKIVRCSDVRQLFGDAPSPNESAAGDIGANVVSFAATAMKSVREATENAFERPIDRDDFLRKFTEGLRSLRDEAEDQGGEVLFSPTNRLASLLQSTLAKNLRRTATESSHLEFAFDKDDTKSVLQQFFDENKNIQPHSPLRPTNTVPDQLSDSAKMFVVGDFGTGLYGAPKTANTIATGTTNYDVLLHLGDIYYSGQPEEVQDRFLNVWPISKGEISRTLNGNHDMYSGGYGYFDLALPTFNQTSSYFAMQNTKWLLVFLDTAYQDNDLDDSQVKWIKDVVSAAGGRGLVLFSHHPLFSNFKAPGDKLRAKLKPLLDSQRITAWYWGHEHHCAIYDKHPDYGFYGRCLGNGGMPSKRKDFFDLEVEEVVGDLNWVRHPSGQRPSVLYLDGPNPDITEKPNKYGPHGYLTLEFSGKHIIETVCSVDGEQLRTQTIKS